MTIAVRTIAPAFRRPTAHRPANFVRGVVASSSWIHWGTALFAVAAMNVAHEIGASFHAADPPPQIPFIVDVPGFLELVLVQGLCLGAGVLVADEIVDRGGRALFAHSAALVLACATAAIIHFQLWFPPASEFIPFRPSEILKCRLVDAASVFADQLLVCGLLVFLHVQWRTARRARLRLHRAEIARLDTRRRTLESRLQAMQARIEPQFLFDTLARLRDLHETDADAAVRMLDDLIAYLRAALPRLRESASTLGQEVDLARAYLDIVRVSRDDPLAIRFDVPPSLGDAGMPPMLLLPLILGISSPGRRAATITIEAAAVDGLLVVTVTDSATSLPPDREAGPLAAIPERLRTLYGDAGRLRLEPLPTRGTRAVLEIPHEKADGRPR